MLLFRVEELFQAICDRVRTEGRVHLLINSGPRYQESWEFYDKMGAHRCGYIPGKYGEGGNAMTWIKSLDAKE